MFIIRRLIDYCSMRALKYDQVKNMLAAQDESLDYIYAVGSNVMRRDKWLERVVKLQNLIDE